MSAVETIRKAAALMRERAEKATPGPWGVGNDTNVARGVEKTGVGSYTAIQSVAEVAEDWDDWDREEAVPVEPEHNAEHIASWHPQVALATAELLEEAFPFAALPKWQEHPIAVKAHALAKAYLGGES